MRDDNLKTIIEALLFAADEPIPIKRIAKVLDVPDSRSVRRAIQDLSEQYNAEGRAFALEEIAGGYQLFTRKDYAPWIAKLTQASAKSKLSRAAYETLAIVAYKQPVQRADIEAIRGVQVGAILRALVEKELVKITGRDESLGRPLLYGTTKKFLDCFGLNSLDDLPKLEMQPSEQAGSVSEAEQSTQHNEVGTNDVAAEPENAPDTTALDALESEDVAPSVLETQDSDTECDGQSEETKSE